LAKHLRQNKIQQRRHARVWSPQTSAGPSASGWINLPDEADGRQNQGSRKNAEQNPKQPQKIDPKLRVHKMNDLIVGVIIGATSMIGFFAGLAFLLDYARKRIFER